MSLTGGDPPKVYMMTSAVFAISCIFVGLLEFAIGLAVGDKVHGETPNYQNMFMVLTIVSVIGACLILYRYQLKLNIVHANQDV